MLFSWTFGKKVCSCGCMRPLSAHTDHLCQALLWLLFSVCIMLVWCVQVKVWLIPDGGLTENLADSYVDLAGHQRRVGIVQWHPTADNILASAGFDYMVRCLFAYTCSIVFALFIEILHDSSRKTPCAWCHVNLLRFRSSYSLVSITVPALKVSIRKVATVKTSLQQCSGPST